MTVKAKFRCDHTATVKTEYGENVVVHMYADIGGTGKDNIDWSEYTPNGKLEMTITQKGAHNAFKPGKKYYLTFDEAE